MTAKASATWQTIREVRERSARLFEALAHGPEPVNHEEQQYDLGQEDHDLEGLDQQLDFPIVHRGLRSVLGATSEAARGALRRTVAGPPGARGQAGPASEGPREGAGLGIAKGGGDLAE